MSMDPAAIQQILMQKLAQGGSPSPVGGGNAGPAMQGTTTPMNAAAQLVQKAMLIKALQNPPPTMAQRQATAAANVGTPGAAATLAMNPQIQAMQQQAQQPLPQQPLNIPDPSLQPTPGWS
jgi:hypothetical protein